ncbi:glycosyltransferase family protein [Portibacter lacus]|uniref:Glycosyl transferase n=1 Tax=Portibacter lacus TaxID=1099794 RepID=A0AA37SNQ8_9BACT|nr:glycosyltransferase family 2 protein [Portibacter lacus]GLR16894.1 hypothetical protein GCM10007940_15090 [Portibacter lacus]
MKVSGFTFIKDALTYDYPILEAIHSVLPICDEFVVAVGKSSDETLALIKSIDSSKIKIIETVWDETMREGGRVLAIETDKAFQAIAKDADWAFYIQGDEVIHEKYLDIVKAAMTEYQDNKKVDGFLFNYQHFYGSYDYIGTSSNWYTHEIRVVRNLPSIYSYRDAQGFRKGENEKLNVIPIDAYIYHYGWVKPPEAMQRKQLNFNKYWHNDDWIKDNVEKVEAYDYEGHVQELALFTGDHPEVMKNRIEKLNWKFDHDISFNRTKRKDKIKRFLKRYLGLDFSYKNYEIIKR